MHRYRGQATPARDDLGHRTAIDGVPMSYDEYLSLPEGSGYSLLGGLLFREPAPTVDHQVVVDNILAFLRKYARASGGGRALREIDVHLDEGHTPVPDVCFVSVERVGHLDRGGLHGIAPDLCVEVLSPSSVHRDRGEKAEAYARHGCREYWIVDPERLRVEVFHRSAQGDFVAAGAFTVGEAFASAALPDLRVGVAEVFAEG